MAKQFLTGIAVPYAAKTSAYTTTASDHTINCDTTSASFNVSLITAVGNTGLRQTIKKMVAANTLTIDPNGSQTIDGATTVALTARYESITIESDGANWIKVADVVASLPLAGGTVTGPVQVPAGSAATASLQMNASNVGFYSQGAGFINVTIVGVEKTSWSSVGCSLGTSDDAIASLHVGGEMVITAANKLIWGTNGATMYRYAQMFSDSGQNFITYRAYDYHRFETATGDGTAGTARLIIGAGPAANVTPGVDNTTKLGTASLRWSEVFAGNATINTSDEREKHIVENSLISSETGLLSDLGRRVWDRVKALSYQWSASVEEKGEARARVHVGFTAQGIEQAFRAEGLDPARFGLWCADPLTEHVAVKRPVKVRKTEKVMREVPAFLIIDGKMTATSTVEEVEEPVSIKHPVFNEDGSPRMMLAQEATDDQEAVYVQETVREPVFEDGEEEVYVDVPVLNEDGSPVMRHGLRYNQCLAYENAWLRTQLLTLTARVAALEAA